MTERLPIAVVTAALALGLAAFAPAASATPTGLPESAGGNGPAAHTSAEANGRRWPGRTITYNESPKDLGVRAAAKTWNRSGIRIRFKRVSSASRADVRVRVLASAGCSGFAQLGWGGPGSQAGMVVGRCARYTQQQISTHEFGHILGLGHEQRACALMNPVLYNGAPNRCEPPGADLYRCRIIERHDLRRAARMYGGKPRPAKRTNCPLYPAPGAFGPLTVSHDGYYVTAGFRAPEAPKPKKRIGFSGQPAWSSQAVLVPGACPADLAPLFAGRPDESPVYGWGREDRYITEGLDGEQCVALRLIDSLGRAGTPSGATVTQPVYEEPPPSDPYPYEEPPPEYYEEEPPP